MSDNGNKSFYEVTGGVKDPATKKYIKTKLKMLEDLYIPVTEEQKAHIRSLKTELEIDRYVRDLIIGK